MNPATADLAIELRTSNVPEGTPSGRTAAEAPPQPAPVAEPAPSGKRNHVRRWVLAIAKRLATLGIALIAILMALVTWDYYVTAPWTRDGRVRVQVASVASQVSGQITELRVCD